jgi:hypothetical protein
MRALLLVVLSGCSGGLQTFTITEDAALADTSVHASLCCQITKVETDSNIWGKGSTYECAPDAALLDPPWVCHLTDPTTCTNPACVVGSTCEGPNGTGNVIVCPEETDQ